MKRAAIVTITPVVRFVEWLFGPRAPGIDLLLGAFASNWGVLMVLKPELFDRTAFEGLSLMPDLVWIVLYALLAGLHALGVANVVPLGIRQGACLLSAWIWISVAVSVGAVEVNTVALNSGIIGCIGLAGALYLSGQPRRTA